MPDLIYRIDTTARHQPDLPINATDAIHRLEEGNRTFARLISPDTEKTEPPHIVRFDADDFGFFREDGTPVTQRPFAAVLGCADARVPLEMILGQATNDLFVVRVAGNVLGAECLGSLDYALTHLGASLKVIVVLGHTVCGAVTAAVDAFMNPGRYLEFASSHPLRAVVDRVFVAIQAAAQGLEQVYGEGAKSHPNYRQALIETSVVMNAAMAAATIRQEFAEQLGSEKKVVFGVYDLISRRVRLPLSSSLDLAIHLAEPPTDSVGFNHLALLVATSESVQTLFR